MRLFYFNVNRLIEENRGRTSFDCMKMKIYELIAACCITLLLFTSASGKVLYYHTDNFGTPMAMTNQTGEVVWQADELPFGEEYETEETPNKNNHRFLGKELDDETGLVYMGARYLDPKTGRFTQPDPVGLVDPASGKVNQEMLLNPQRLNRYVYGLNNPYKYVDPDGKFAFTTAAVVVWGITEIGLSISDAASTAQTIADPQASLGEKAMSVGMFAAGVVGPGGGGSTALKASKGVVNPRLLVRTEQLSGRASSRQVKKLVVIHTVC